MAQVLVVDDDRGIRELLKLALELEGYVVATLSDGAAVVETLAGSAEPWIVLLDVNMPWVDGLEVCRRLAAEPELAARHRVVLMTARPPLDEQVPQPASALLVKPFQLEPLFRLLASLALPASAHSQPGCGTASMPLAS